MACQAFPANLLPVPEIFPIIPGVGSVATPIIVKRPVARRNRFPLRSLVLTTSDLVVLSSFGDTGISSPTVARHGPSAACSMRPA